MYYFIVNKTSGNGKGSTVWEKVKKLLNDKGVSYNVIFTEGSSHAANIVKSLSLKSIKAVVVIGGDGTIHAIANGLVDMNIPLGIIPAGSGNDFARSLKIPRNEDLALKRILEGTAKKMDIAKMGEAFYLTIAGLGFDGKVAEVTNKSNTKKWLNRINLGSLSYVVSVFKVLFTYKPTTVTLFTNGEELTFRDVWLISIANLPFYGGGIMICPEAKADDGLLDICIVHGIGKWELLFVFPRAFTGKHITHKHVTMLKRSQIEVFPKSEMVVQCDGEILSHNEMKFSVIKDGLLVL